MQTWKVAILIGAAYAFGTACAVPEPIVCDVGGNDETFVDCDALEQEAGCRLLDAPDTDPSDIDDLEQCLADKCHRPPPADCNTDGHNV